MNRIWLRIQTLLASRSPRERWLLAACAVLIAFMLVFSAVIRPLRASLSPSRAQVVRLEDEFAQALRMAADIRALQGELHQVEARISPGESTNLFALLEDLARQARVKDQLESIKPKQPSGNDRYPETRVEVQLKGATLEQTVKFLHKIETAPKHLIIRAIRVRARPDGSQLLDVSFSVSSFQRA